MGGVDVRHRVGSVLAAVAVGASLTLAAPLQADPPGGARSVDAILAAVGKAYTRFEPRRVEEITLSEQVLTCNASNRLRSVLDTAARLPGRLQFDRVSPLLPGVGTEGREAVVSVERDGEADELSPHFLTAAYEGKCLSGGRLWRIPVRMQTRFAGRSLAPNKTDAFVVEIGERFYLVDLLNFGGLSDEVRRFESSRRTATRLRSEVERLLSASPQSDTLSGDEPAKALDLLSARPQGEDFTSTPSMRPSGQFFVVVHDDRLSAGDRRATFPNGPIPPGRGAWTLPRVQDIERCRAGFGGDDPRRMPRVPCQDVEALGELIERGHECPFVLAAESDATVADIVDAAAVLLGMDGGERRCDRMLFLPGPWLADTQDGPFELPAIERRAIFPPSGNL